MSLHLHYEVIKGERACNPHDFLPQKLAKFNKQNHVEAINTIVGEGSVVEGHFEVTDSIRVDGTLRGKITSSGSLIVSTQGEIDADLIQVKDAVVDGCVKGPLDASHSVRLGPSAEVDGGHYNSGADSRKRCCIARKHALWDPML